MLLLLDKGKNPPSLIEWMESDEFAYKVITRRNKESGVDDYFIYRGGDLDENVSEDMIISLDAILYP